jgi:hypothetical protein
MCTLSEKHPISRVHGIGWSGGLSACRKKTGGQL